MRGLLLIPLLLVLVGTMGAGYIAADDDCARTCPQDAGTDPCSPLCEDCPFCLASQAFVSEDPVAPAVVRPAYAIPAPREELGRSAYTGEILHVPKPACSAI